LHGLGDVGQSWLRAFQEYNIPEKTKYIKYIFPTAKVIPVTLNMGMRMTSWFDVLSLEVNAKEDQKGIEASTQLLHELIKTEIANGIPPERIIVGGFSMGGAVALHGALTEDKVLGGVLALSTWLPLVPSFPDYIKNRNEKVNIPIFHGHGKQDELVQLKWAEMSSQALKSSGFVNYQFKTYDMGHSSCDKELKDVSEFIQQTLPPTK